MLSNFLGHLITAMLIALFSLIALYLLPAVVMFGGGLVIILVFWIASSCLISILRGNNING